jgi:hypothetical protein
MSTEGSPFNPLFDVGKAVDTTKQEGYYFLENALAEETRMALEREIDALPLEVGDHVSHPINQGKQNEVKQQHERLYVAVGDIQTPTANLVVQSITNTIKGLIGFPELNAWQLNEIGYQRYRHSKDFIGPHRDRASDRFLSITLTINGKAPVKVFETTGDYWDYSQLKQTDEFVTSPGSIMMLRAPGLGNSEQIVHQVLPPESSRAILNLRDRPTVLEAPSNPKWSK